MKKSIESVEDAIPAFNAALTRSIPLTVGWSVQSIGGVTFEATHWRFNGFTLDLYREAEPLVTCNLGLLLGCAFAGSFEELGDGLKLDLRITWPENRARCDISCDRSPTPERELRVQ